MERWTRRKLGTTIKAARTKKGISHFDAAKDLGVTPQIVAKWEKAKVLPSPDKARRIAEFVSEPLAPIKEFLLREKGWLDDEDHLKVVPQYLISPAKAA